MSLFGILNTAVSGLSAQASYLGTIGDNIANQNTTGYKQSSTEFETLLGNQATSSYESGGVQTRVRYGISDQGNIIGTTSSTDLAIKGGGFFMVQDASGASLLTRAGSFVEDSKGNLVNTAGLTLMGNAIQNGVAASTLSPVNLSSQGLTASPSTAGTLSPNLDSNAAVDTGTPPSANAAGSTYTSKTSLVSYDNVGNPVTLDIYFTKTAANTWQADVYNQADATNGTFPYANSELAGQTLTFDPTTGKLAAGSPTSMTVNVPNGPAAGVNIDLSKATELASGFTPGTPTIDGSSPSTVDKISVGKDGIVTAIYKNGVQRNLFQVPLANVPSPDLLTSVTGNAYQVSLGSGPVSVGTAMSGSLGEIDSSSLEQSTVDIATELTNMISSERSYEANSKVITTTNELLQAVTNLVT